MICPVLFNSGIARSFIRTPLVSYIVRIPPEHMLQYLLRIGPQIPRRPRHDIPSVSLPTSLEWMTALKFEPRKLMLKRLEDNTQAGFVPPEIGHVPHRQHRSASTNDSRNWTSDSISTGGSKLVLFLARTRDQAGNYSSKARHSIPMYERWSIIAIAFLFELHT